MDARDMGQDLEKVLFTEEQINDKLAELAAQIDEHYAGRNILVVGVLRGAVMVVADLVRKIHSPVAMDWMAVSSYGAGTKSSGLSITDTPRRPSPSASPVARRTCRSTCWGPASSSACGMR